MIPDKEIETAATINNLQRKIHRAIKNGDDETFIESYLELVDCCPDLQKTLGSICEFFNTFKITVGGVTKHD